MEKPFFKRELLDAGWLAQNGQEAAKFGLNKAEQEMCKSLGISPEKFAESKKNLEITAALVNGQTGEVLVDETTGEVVVAKAVDLLAGNEYPQGPLTPAQLKLCDELGITEETFRNERAKLAAAAADLA